MGRIALLGGKGYIGTQLATHFVRNGFECDVFDMPEFDVTSEECWKNFSSRDYSSICFFAGLTGTEKSFTSSGCFHEVNERGLLNLLQKLAPLGESAPKIIFPSSRLVYKGSDSPLLEDATKEAKTVYAANKLACEYMLQAFGMRYGIRSVVIRICVPYGNIVSHVYSYGTVGFFLEQASTGRITLYGDGSLRRTFTHVGDICEIVGRLVSTDCLGTFNIGGNNLSLKDAASMIAAKKGAKVVTVPWPDVALRMESGSTIFDSTLLDRTIDYGEYRSFSDFVNGL